MINLAVIVAAEIECSPIERSGVNILVLCTGNSCRSIMLEAILRKRSGGKFKVFSAGSNPVGYIHPEALKLLERRGHNTAYLRSKSWNEFTGAGSPRMSLVITVCNNAASEQCPVWTGKPEQIHWGVADPAVAEGSSKLIREAFEKIYSVLDSYAKELCKDNPLAMTRKELNSYAAHSWQNPEHSV